MTDEPQEAPAAGAPISPGDIQKQEFGVSRFGGYRMRDVDEFLDRLTESTEALVAENERLGAGGADHRRGERRRHPSRLGRGRRPSRRRRVPPPGARLLAEPRRARAGPR